MITMGCGDACPIFPANATNAGTTSTTPPASTPQPYAPFAPTSNAASDNLIDELALTPAADQRLGGR